MQAPTDLFTDEQLLARGDADAFALVYDRHVRRVYTHCARQLGCMENADDATAIVFLEAWRRRSAIRPVSGSALPWLLMTGTNVTRNLQRASRRYQRVLRRLPPPPVTPDHGDAISEARASAAANEPLARALNGLGETDRHVVSLCMVSGLTYAETADVLGVSHAAVRSRLARSRQHMRDALALAGSQASMTWKEIAMSDRPIQPGPIAPELTEARAAQIRQLIIEEATSSPPTAPAPASRGGCGCRCGGPGGGRQRGPPGSQRPGRMTPRAATVRSRPPEIATSGASMGSPRRKTPPA